VCFKPAVHPPITAPEADARMSFLGVDGGWQSLLTLYQRGPNASCVLEIFAHAGGTGTLVHYERVV